MADTDDRLVPLPEDDRPLPYDNDRRPRRRRRDDDDLPPRKTNTVLIVVLVLGGLAIVAGIVVVGFLPSAVVKVREAAARSESQNKLKQMTLTIHGMVSATDRAMPPATGVYPLSGPNATIFFHILPALESSNIYSTYRANPVNGPIGATVTIKTYCAPTDPTNPGMNTNLTSYAANAWLFGNVDGGSIRLSTLINGKGSSNTVAFMERYAQPGWSASGASAHFWAQNASTGTSIQPWVYMNNFTTATTALPLNTSRVEGPIFGVVAANITPAQDPTAHAFSGNTIQVGIVDGSARSITESVNTILSTGGTQTIWRWSVSASGATAQLPPPAGW